LRISLVSLVKESILRAFWFLQWAATALARAGSLNRGFATASPMPRRLAEGRDVDPTRRLLPVYGAMSQI
jgi:hypothetical protein